MSMALVGANVVVARVLAEALPIPLLLFLRCFLACLVLAPSVIIPRPAMLPRGGLARNLALQAAFGTVLYNVALLAGLRRTGALEAGLVLSTMPAVVALGAFLLLRERLGPRRLIAVALAALGMAALTVGRTKGAGAAGTLAGDALVFVAVCGEAAYVLLSKRMSARIGTMSAAFWMQAFSALFLFPLVIPWSAVGVLGGTSWRIWLLLIFHSVTASVLCLLLWYRGVRQVPANVAGIFTTLLPATAGLTAILFLNEALTPAHVAGFALLLLSFVLAASS